MKSDRNSISASHPTLRGVLLSMLAFAFSLHAGSAVRGAEGKSGDGWRSLTLVRNGHLDESWRHVGWGGLTVDGGSLRTECDAKGLGLLVYQKERFGNCQIRVVFKCKDVKSNSGVFVRIADEILDQVNIPGAAFDRDAAGRISAASMKGMMASADREEGPWFAVHRGYEVQIMDANDGFHRTGAIYSLAASSGFGNKTPGEWKTMIITLSGSHISVDLDGERVTSFDPDDPSVPRDRNWFEPKREPKRPMVGYIGLQNHDPGDVVWFREVSVRPLVSTRAAVPLWGRFEASITNVHSYANPFTDVVFFRVTGTITLKNAIRVRTPYLTVAGQSSPGGIEIRGAGQPEGDWGVWFVNGAHDIVIRHLRVRMGRNMKHDAGNNLLFYGTAEPGVHDVIVDHCSVSWGSDTQLDWYGSYLDRATFQWNIIGECFMGQHIGGNQAPKHLTLHHNLYANLSSRTPLMQHARVFDFRNNVIYNWSGNNASVFGQFALNTSAFGNVVDNLWLAGPESGYPYLNVGNGGPVRIDGSRAQDGGTKLYLVGNWGPRSPTGSTNDWSGHGVNTWDYYELNHDGSTHLVDQAQYAATEPFPAPLVKAEPVSHLLEVVLASAGACKPTRDAIDQRIVKSGRDKTGSSRINTTGPWPDLSSTAPEPPVDSDHDGMPDAWETAHGLEPKNPRDGAAIAASGYSNVENYLNELAGDPIP